MDSNSLAPCGVLCDLCLGFQRNKNKCVGCNHEGYKPYHCTVCSITLCAEKNGNKNLLCGECAKFPCRRIKDLDKRYTLKYGESPVQNLRDAKSLGMVEFLERETAKWKCPNCGELLCVHSGVCLSCGGKNEFFPQV
jgi:hypothetical protein